MKILKHKSQENNKIKTNEITPELNHHFISSRRSRALAQVIPTKNKRWNSSSQNKTYQPRPAFTIIEVVLVLAIAGLIFLMVFIALPALQRNQRDTQRKNDMNQLADVMERYKSNNKGVIPGASQIGPAGSVLSLRATNLFNTYMSMDKDSFKDPDSTGYLISLDHPNISREDGRPGHFNHVIHLATSFKCNGSSLTSAPGANRYAIQYRLEGGGVYCIDG